MSETIAEIRARASEASKADPAYLKAVIGIKAAKAFEDRATLLLALDEAQERAAQAEWRPIETAPSDLSQIIEVYTCAPSPPGHAISISRRMLDDQSGPRHLRTSASHWRPHIPPKVSSDD